MIIILTGEYDLDEVYLCVSKVIHLIAFEGHFNECVNLRLLRIGALIVRERIKISFRIINLSRNSSFIAIKGKGYLCVYKSRSAIYTTEF